MSGGRVGAGCGSSGGGNAPVVDVTARASRDRGITADLARLGDDVKELQRSISTTKAAGGAGTGAGAAAARATTAPADPASPGKPGGPPPSVGNEWVDRLIQGHQAEYCRLKDTHFEEKRRLEEEVHRLRKRLHLTVSDLDIAKHNCLEMERAMADRAAGVELATVRRSLRERDASANSLAAQNQEAERQIAELRASLEEAIQAISKQYRENTALVKKVRQLGSGLTPQQRASDGEVDRLTAELARAQDSAVQLEREVWKIGAVAGAPPEADFSSVLSLIAARVDVAAATAAPVVVEPPPELLASLAAAEAAADGLRAELAAAAEAGEARTAAAVGAAEQRVRKYLVELRDKDDVINDLTKEKRALAARVKAAAAAAAASEEGAGAAAAAAAAEAAAAARTAVVEGRLQEAEAEGAEKEAAAREMAATLEEVRGGCRAVGEAHEALLARHAELRAEAEGLRERAEAAEGAALVAAEAGAGAAVVSEEEAAAWGVVSVRQAELARHAGRLAAAYKARLGQLAGVAEALQEERRQRRGVEERLAAAVEAAAATAQQQQQQQQQQPKDGSGETELVEQLRKQVCVLRFYYFIFDYIFGYRVVINNNFLDFVYFTLISSSPA